MNPIANNSICSVCISKEKRKKEKKKVFNCLQFSLQVHFKMSRFFTFFRLSDIVMFSKRFTLIYSGIHIFFAPEAFFRLFTSSNRIKDSAWRAIALLSFFFLAFNSFIQMSDREKIVTFSSRRNNRTGGNFEKIYIQVLNCNSSSFHLKNRLNSRL